MKNGTTNSAKYAAFIVLLGFALRLYKLGGPSLWYDEMWTYLKINSSLSETIRCLTASGYPPLYYVLMSAWVKLAGTTEFALRLPSLVFSAVSVFIIYKLSSYLYNRKVGLISAFLLSISPYSINYAQEAKMYGMLWCLLLLALIYFVKYAAENKNTYLLPYTILGALSMYTHYISVIFLIANNLVFFILYDERSKRKNWLISQAAIILLFFPWFEHMKTLEHAQYKIDAGNYLTDTMNSLRVISGIGIAGDNFASILMYILFAALICLALISFKRMKARAHSSDTYTRDLLLICLFIFPILMLYFAYKFFSATIAQTYLGFIHIPAIILISKGIGRFGPRARAAIVTMIFAITLTNHLLPYYSYSLKIGGQDWRRLYDELAEKADDNSIVAFYGPAYYTSYYYENRFNTKPLGFVRDVAYYSESFDSIFIVYCVMKNDPRDKIIPPNRYTLYEDHAIQGDIGFLWYKKTD